MIVTIDYTLKDSNGEVIDSSEKSGSLTYLHGFKNIIEGLEEALEGKKAGDSFSVAIPPAKGYGLRDNNMVFTVPADNFKNQEDGRIEPGMEFETVINDKPYILTVLEVKNNKVKVDANHPLAGKPLYFDVKVLNIRDSYSDELAQGYPIDE
jgi:FKBP-type peptidyl-prolyl cis-trans isomerase SlyD